jgi:hypothetical protein
MAEATCSAQSPFLTSTATSTVTITTTAPHQLALNHSPGVRALGIGALACIFLFAIPGRRRRRFPLALLLLVCAAGFGGCGGGVPSIPPVTDQGTLPGTYTVNVTATSLNITRTGTFTVTVQ